MLRLMDLGGGMIEFFIWHLYYLCNCTVHLKSFANEKLKPNLTRTSWEESRGVFTVQLCSMVGRVGGGWALGADLDAVEMGEALGIWGSTGLAGWTLGSGLGTMVSPGLPGLVFWGQCSLLMGHRRQPSLSPSPSLEGQGLGDSQCVRVPHGPGLPSS